MDNNNKSLCDTEYIVISCSGASDTGEITDNVARRLRKNLVRSMNCLASVGAGNQDLIEKLKESNLLLIDGCMGDCAKKIADKAGIRKYHHLRITDLGYEKGKTPVTEEVLNQVYLTADKI